MEFDPTKNYYGMDISKEPNRLIWEFWEFVKNLVTLSSSTVKQKETLDYAAEEMAVDFESYYTWNYEKYLNHGLLKEEHIVDLNQLDKFLEDRSGDKMPDFWDDDLLDVHLDWKEVRSISKEILKSLGYNNLTIESNRTNSKAGFYKGRRLQIEGLKTILVKREL